MWLWAALYYVLRHQMSPQSCQTPILMMYKIWSTACVYVYMLNRYFIFQWSRTQHWVCISVARNHFDLDQMFETLMWRLTAWIVCQLASDPESGDNRCQIHKICKLLTMNDKSNESISQGCRRFLTISDPRWDQPISDIFI